MLPSSPATPSRTKADAGTGRLPQGWLLRESDRYLACVARAVVHSPHYDGRASFRWASLSDVTLIATYATFPRQLSGLCARQIPGMKIDRPGMAIIGAVLMVAFGALSPSDALRFVDLGTIVRSWRLRVTCLRGRYIPAIGLRGEWTRHCRGFRALHF